MLEKGKGKGKGKVVPAKWYPLHWHYKYKLALTVYKSTKSVTPLSSLFQSQDNFYTLRGENKLSLPQPTTEILKRSLAYRGSRLWNLLYDSLICKEFNKFKTAVKSVLNEISLDSNMKLQNDHWL